MTLKKSKIYTDVIITDLTDENYGVGRIDGIVVFVLNTVPGDTVSIKITGQKKSVARAIVHEVIMESEFRTKPFCDHFGICGGCTRQHISYVHQLNIKEENVRNHFKRIAGLKDAAILPIIPAKETEYYRNKLEYTFSNNRWILADEPMDTNIQRSGLGFHIKKSFYKVVDVNHCHLQKEPSNEIRNKIKEYALQNNIPFFNHQSKEGYLRNLIIRTTSCGQSMVVLSVASEEKKWFDGLMNCISTSGSSINSIMYAVNGKPNDSLSDIPIKLYKGENHIVEEIEGIKYNIGPKTFFQPNYSQACEILRVINEYGDFRANELVFDLYCGIGMIALQIASSANQVVGIEYELESVKSARQNAVINGIRNCTFHSGDMRIVLDNVIDKMKRKPDSVILDPPRAGLHPAVTSTLNRILPQKIIYVSCNTSTQARDIAALKDNYKVEKIQPIDMFPHTRHVENIALLIRK